MVANLELLLPSLSSLPAVALTVGVLHTLIGPDHYLPLAALGKARRWGVGRLMWITVVCGGLHVGSSVLIGLLALAFGWQLGSVQGFESFRGGVAGWMVLGLGLAYLLWAIRGHLRRGIDATSHRLLESAKRDELVAVAPTTANDSSNRPVRWWLMLVFGLGPCEVLIPLLMFPAVQQTDMARATTAASSIAVSGWPLALLASVVGCFAIATIGTMVAAVLAVSYGLKLSSRLWPAQGWLSDGHVLAGAAVIGCGLLMTIGL
jgi:nickel/cobalt transporter (NicO) family protein